MKKNKVEWVIDYLKNHWFLAPIIFLAILFISIAGVKDAWYSLFGEKEKTQFEQYLEKEISIQNKLLDANRKNNITELTAILSQITHELTIESNRTKEISTALTNRIISFSKILTPYLYLRNGHLIESELNPERGQLFLAIALSDINPSIKRNLFAECDFRHSDLSQINIRNMLIEAQFEDIDLSYSDFSNSKFSTCCLLGVKLNNCNFSNVEFNECDIISCDFSNTKIERSEILFTDLVFCKFYETSFMKSTFQDVNFKRSEFYRGNYSGINILPTDFEDDPGLYFDGAILIKENWFEFQRGNIEIAKQSKYYSQDTFIEGGVPVLNVEGKEIIEWFPMIRYIELQSKTINLKQSSIAKAIHSRLFNTQYDIADGDCNTIGWYRTHFDKKAIATDGKLIPGSKSYPRPVQSRLMDKLNEDFSAEGMITMPSENIFMIPMDTSDHIIKVVRKGTLGLVQIPSKAIVP